MKTTLVMLCLVGAAAAWPFGSKMKQVRVKGTFNCGGRPVANAQVKMIDKDTGSDDQMDDNNQYTNAQGYFEITGQESSGLLGLNNPDPVIKVYHRCTYGKEAGTGPKRRAIFFVPDKYIGTSKNPAATMNLGEINLEVQMEKSPKSWRRF